MFVGSGVTIAPLQPEDVDMLRSIMLEWCQEYGCEPQGKLAQDRAKKLMWLFEGGIRDRETLLSAIRPF